MTETHTVLVGTLPGKPPTMLEHIHPHYDLPARITEWTRLGWTNVHPATQTITYTPLTPKGGNP